METLHKARLTALHAICLQIFRHIAQKSLAIRQYACGISMQSAEKSDYASYAQALFSVSLKQSVKIPEQLAVLLRHLRHTLFQVFVLHLCGSLHALGLKILLMSQCVLYIQQFFTGHLIFTSAFFTAESLRAVLWKHCIKLVRKMRSQIFRQIA